MAKTDPLGPRSASERLWTVDDVAAYLGVPVQTLYQWRYLQSGPPAYRVGRHLRYDPSAVLSWLEAGGTRGR